MALDAKKSNKINPKEIRPIFEPLMKVSTKFIRPWLYVFAGTISTINPCNCVLIPFLETKGRLGINVNRKRQVGGIDMMKL